jgi:hypothetical protein
VTTCNRVWRITIRKQEELAEMGVYHTVVSYQLCNYIWFSSLHIVRQPALFCWIIAILIWNLSLKQSYLWIWRPFPLCWLVVGIEMKQLLLGKCLLSVIGTVNFSSILPNSFINSLCGIPAIGHKSNKQGNFSETFICFIQNSRLLHAYCMSQFLYFKNFQMYHAG